MSDYMRVLILAGFLPFVLSFYPPLKIYRYGRSLLYSIFLIIIIFGVWDIFATWRGHWAFNPEGVGDFKIINLPMEEVLFFVVIPFCCIFTWEVVKYFRKKVFS